MLTENKEEKGFGKVEIDLRISKACSELELYKGTLRKKNLYPSFINTYFT